MKSYKLIKTLTGLILSAMLAAVGQAEVTVSDFSNFTLDGTYADWGGGTFTSGATAFTVQSTAFGGGYKNVAVNASGNDTVSIRMNVNPGNAADKFNIVLFDGDGTARVYRFENIAVGNNQTFTKNVASFLQDNAAGSVPGLDLATITAFHLQGTFANSNALNMTFDKLSFVVAPFVPDQIPNGGFEISGGPMNVGLDWQYFSDGFTATYQATGGNPNGNVVLDGTVPGGYGVMVAFNNTERSTTSLGLTPGGPCTIKMDMKLISGTNVGGLKLEGPSGFAQIIEPAALAGVGIWATYTFNFTLQNGLNPVTQFKIVPLAKAGSIVAIDNVQIVLPGPTPPAQPSVVIGKMLNWTPTVATNLYQPQESSDNIVFTNLSPAFVGTAGSSIFDPSPAAFYRVQEATPVVVQAALNGGFEATDGFGDPDLWNLFGGNLPVRITTDFHTGTACMRLNPIGSAGMGAVSGLEQNILNQGGSITAGSTYTCSFWKKQVSVADGYVQEYRVVYLNTGGSELAGTAWTVIPTGNIGTWVQVTLPGQVAPATATSALIQINGKAGGFVGSFGEVLIDDVSLQSPGAGTPTTIASTSASAAEISWQSVTGQSYQVRSSTDLSGWSSFSGVITGNNGLKAVYDTPLVTKKFYQLGTQ